MNKLIAAALAFAFALGPTIALADDTTQNKMTPEEQAKAKAERQAAKEQRAKMTPEEKKAAKKARAKQKEKEMAQAEKVGNPQVQKGETISKSASSTKSDPKALPTKEEKQKSLKEQEKKSSGQ